MSRFTTVIIAIMVAVLAGAVGIGGALYKGQYMAVAPIVGFLAPTIAALLALAQGINNSEKQVAVSQQVAAVAVQTAKVQNQSADTANKVDTVNDKIDGHISKLMDLVLNSAATGQPVDASQAAQAVTDSQRIVDSTNVRLEVAATAEKALRQQTADDASAALLKGKKA